MFNLNELTKITVTEVEFIDDSKYEDYDKMLVTFHIPNLPYTYTIQYVWVEGIMLIDDGWDFTPVVRFHDVGYFENVELSAIELELLSRSILADDRVIDVIMKEAN